MPLDLEFYITIGGKDVTSDVTSWELHDNEEGLSTITVVIVSPDNKYAGIFTTQDEIALSWGTGSQMLGPVEFKVRRKRERWTRAGWFIELRALDWTERLAGLNYSGMFDDDKAEKAAQEALEKAGLKIDMKMKGPKELKDHKQSAMRTPGNQLLDELQAKCSPITYLGDEEPYPELRKATKESSSQQKGVTVRKGATIHGGPTKASVKPEEGAGELSEAGKNAVEKNRIDNQAKHAGSLSIRGRLLLADYPSMKAKRCVTVLNAGSEGSGIWYVAGVKHRWNVNAGYTAHCDLLRIDTKKDQQNTQSLPTEGAEGAKPMGLKGAPIVRYAKIFEKNMVYLGPRPLNAGSQATFTVGDGTHIIAFSWIINVQVPKDVGDQAYNEDLAPNLINKKFFAKAWTGAVQPHGSPTT